MGVDVCHGLFEEKIKAPSRGKLRAPSPTYLVRYLVGFLIKKSDVKKQGLNDFKKGLTGPPARIAAGDFYTPKRYISGLS